MPSGSSSPDASIKTVVLVLALAAALIPAAASAFPLEAPADSSVSAPAPAASADTLRSAEPPPDAMTVPAQPPASPLSMDKADGEPPKGAVNPRKALLLSLLLPGSGELYSGHKGRATGFFVSEGLIWANFAVWQVAGHLRRDDYIEQAQLNAGVGTDSESDDYWRLVGTYSSSSGSGNTYEDELRRDARNEFPSDPAAQDAWVAERLPTGNRAWTWTNASLQDNYILTRRSSTRAFNRAKFSFALAILNRVASAIDTQILHRGDMKAGQSSVDTRLQILTGVTADGGGRLLVRQTF